MGTIETINLNNTELTFIGLLHISNCIIGIMFRSNGLMFLLILYQHHQFHHFFVLPFPSLFNSVYVFDIWLAVPCSAIMNTKDESAMNTNVEIISTAEPPEQSKTMCNTSAC